MASEINRTFFFDRVRSNLFAGSLKKGQIEGMNFIIDEWETNHASKDDRWLAYALGTTFHETAFTMRPIHEFGGNKYFFDMYDPKGKRPKVAKELGTTEPGDGVLFHGRGYVQLTGRNNYTAMQIFEPDLTSGKAAADRVLDRALAAKIMFKGMEDGIFTTRKFSQYFDGAVEDWREARRIINGLDKADKIAQYGREFYGAISYTT